MDAHRFDSLTRSLTDVRSRRGALSALLGGALGLLELADAAAKKKGKGKGKKKKKKKKFKPPCNHELNEVLCGQECCNTITGTATKCCDGACIPTSSCCLPEGEFTDGQRYEQCGVCRNGFLEKDEQACLTIDPAGCNPCTGYQCIAGKEGEPCLEGGKPSACGICDGGLCHDKITGGAPRKSCGSICCLPGLDKCCPGDTHCCPATTTCCPGSLINGCCPSGTICCPNGTCGSPPGVPC